MAGYVAMAHGVVCKDPLLLLGWVGVPGVPDRLRLCALAHNIVRYIQPC